MGKPEGSGAFCYLEIMVFTTTSQLQLWMLGRCYLRFSVIYNRERFTMQTVGSTSRSPVITSCNYSQYYKMLLQHWQDLPGKSFSYIPSKEQRKPAKQQNNLCFQAESTAKGSAHIQDNSLGKKTEITYSGLDSL